MTKTFRRERDVKAEVKKLLTSHGWFWWMPPANAFGRSGISDFHALRSGVFMAVETKFKKNRMTAPQEGFLTSINSEMGLAFCVSEAQLGALEAWLSAFDRSVIATQKGGKPDDEDGATMLNAQIAMSGKDVVE